MTLTAEAPVERAKADGLKIMGIHSRRTVEDDPDPNYELLELDTLRKGTARARRRCR